MSFHRRHQVFPHEDKLGVFLVEEYLGEHCGQVAHELSTRGRLSFPNLVESLGTTKSTQELIPRSALYDDAGQPETVARPSLAPHEVGKAVAVLSHHGLITTVRAQPHNRGRTRSKHQVLQLDLRNILLRLRIPTYTIAVQEFFYPGSIAGSPFGSRAHDEMEGPQDLPSKMSHYWLRTLLRTVAVCGQITTKRLFDLAIRAKENDEMGEDEDEDEDAENDRDEEEEEEEEDEDEEAAAEKAEKQEKEDIIALTKWFSLLCVHYIIVPSKGRAVMEERHVPKKSAGGNAAKIAAKLATIPNPPCKPLRQEEWSTASGTSSSSTNAGGKAGGKRKRTESSSSTHLSIDPENDEMYYTLNAPLLHRFLQDDKCIEYMELKTSKIVQKVLEERITMSLNSSSSSSSAFTSDNDDDGNDEEDDGEDGEGNETGAPHQAAEDERATEMHMILKSLFRAAREKGHHTQGTNQSSLLTIRDVYNAQKSPLYALSDSFMGDAKDKKDVRKKPKKIAVKQIVEVLLLLSNMPALELIQWFDPRPTSISLRGNDMPILDKKFRLTNQTIVERVQLDTVEDFVFERCGEMSYRIFRMLMDKGHLDQKAISEEALIPLRTVRICLAQMTKDGLVQLQEVAKRTDRTPQNTWFFWGVNLQRTYSSIIEFIYRSIYNLTLRRARGVDENEDMVRRYETSGGVNFMSPEELTPEVGYKACRDTDRVGTVVEVDKELQTFSIRWPDTEVIESKVEYGASSSSNSNDVDDMGMLEQQNDQIMLAEETQLTEKDMNQYNALLLATDRIDHTIQMLDEKLLIMYEFHETTRILQCSLATQLNLITEDDSGVVMDEDEEEMADSSDSDGGDIVVSKSRAVKRGRR